MGGCSAQYLDEREEVLTFTKTDLEAALVDARQHKDKAAVACYTTLLEKLERIGPAPVGAISGFQHARNIRRFMQDEEVHVNCSPLTDDAKESVLKVTRILKIIP